MREEAVRDPDAEAELRDIELDLLDAAARATLDPDRQHRVETYLAPATHNRDGWQLARALAEREARATSAPAGRRLRDAAEKASADRDPRGSRGMPPEVSRVSSRWFVGWPAAAAILIAATGLAFYLRATSPSGPESTVAVARPDSDHASAPSSASTPPSLSTGAPSSISATPPAPAGKSSAPSPSSPNAGASEPATPPPTRRALAAGDVALYLPASILRGSRPSVSVTSATQTVRLDIEIEAPAPSRVDIAVRAVPEAGEPLYSEKGVRTARERGGEHVATVDVPARVLSAGAMEVVVSTPDARSAPRVYPFLLRRD